MTLGRLGATCSAALLLLATAIAGPGAAWAAGLPEIFIVSGVPVDSTAASAADARVRALADGTREAYTRLLRRFTLRADWPKLPVADQAGLDAVVLGIEINDEHTSSTRYLAKLTVSFQPNPIRTLLRGHNIPFSETVARPALVLPVWRTGGHVTLWEDGNPWRAAWSKVDLSKELRPLLSPLGDLQDVAAIDAEAAVKGDSGKLLALAKRYGAGEVLVAVATPSASGIDISLNGYGDSGTPPTLVRSVAGTMPAVLDTAVAAVAGDLDEAWKQQTILRFGQEATLMASVSFSSLGEWQQVRQALARTPDVRRVDILGLSTRGADLTLHYLGDPQHLTIALAQQNLQLAAGDPMQPQVPWPLRLRSPATTAPASTPIPTGAPARP